MATSCLVSKHHVTALSLDDHYAFLDVVQDLLVTSSQDSILHEKQSQVHQHEVANEQVDELEANVNRVWDQKDSVHFSVIVEHISRTLSQLNECHGDGTQPVVIGEEAKVEDVLWDDDMGGKTAVLAREGPLEHRKDCLVVNEEFADFRSEAADDH